MNKQILMGAMVILSTTAACGGTTGTSSDPSGSSLEQSAGITVSGFAMTVDGAPVADVDVCYLVEGMAAGAGKTGCATSGADGSYSLSGVRANAPISITFDKPGYIAMLRPVQTGATDLAIPLDEGRLLATNEMPSGMAMSPSGGAIRLSGALRDATTLTRDGVRVAPTYIENTHGLFADLGIGYYEVTLPRSSEKCLPATAIEGFLANGADENMIRFVVPVHEGYVTVALANCGG